MILSVILITCGGFFFIGGLLEGDVAINLGGLLFAALGFFGFYLHSEAEETIDRLMEKHPEIVEVKQYDGKSVRYTNREGRLCVADLLPEDELAKFGCRRVGG